MSHIFFERTVDAVPPNSALVTDVCAAALRAFFNAAQRER